MIMLKNIKKILFKVYLIYTIAYIFDFVLRHRILHFEDWSFLIMILFLFSISIFKHAYESFLIFIISFIIAIFFKVGSFSEGLKIFELYSENFFSIRTFLFIIFSIMMCYFNFKNEKKNIENIEELYEERKEDLEYIQRFIKNDERKVNVLGIDGEFGTGKTFLIEKSIENLKSNNNYEFIKIRCLLLERDEVYSYITQQLDRVLKKNLIFTGHFEKLKNSLIKGMDNKLFGGLSDILISENLLDDIENFKKTLSQLEKTIVIIFDDIDRIGDSEKIDKILSFISDFSGKNIKIIILYNLENLKAINEKYERRYIEKYIPIVRELTPISFSKLLRKEIENYNLDLEDFRFLLSLEDSTNKLYEDYSERLRDNKFINDIEVLVSQKIEFKLKVTPRNLKNFMEEIYGYFSKKELDIENRIMIAYTFLKHVYYDEFYSKIEFNKTLEEMFPIRIQLIEDNINLSLEELDLLKNLIQQFNRNKIKLKSIFNELYIELNNKRFFLVDNNIKEENSLNAFFKKMNLSEIKKEEKDKKKILYERIDELKKKFQNQNFEIKKESLSNLFIFSLFNYNLFYSTLDEDKVGERSERIEGAIKKLKYIGNKEYYSSYQRFYKKLAPSLEKEDFDIINNDYQELLDEYYFNDGTFKGVFYFGETFEEKTMKILNTLGNIKEEEKFLELVFKREKNRISDKYLQTFFISKIDNVKISDFIIENILKNNIEIKDIFTINKLKENLDRILKRISFYEYEGLDLENDEFFEFIKDRLESKKTKESFEYLEITSIEEIRNSIDKYIEFIDKILELLKRNNVFLKEPHMDIKVNSRRFSDEVEQIKKIKTKKEKIQELKKLFYEEKYSIENLNMIFKEIISEKDK